MPKNVLNKSQIDEINEIYNEVCEDWQKRMKNIFGDLIEEPFKEGDWVIGTKQNIIVRIEFLKKNEIHGYGIDALGNWKTNDKTETKCWFGDNLAAVRKATKEEIEKALIKEAEKRGLTKAEAIIKDLAGVTHQWGRDCWMFEYNHNTDTLLVHNKVIYRKGRWAEILSSIPKKVQKLIDKYGKEKLLEYINE